MESEQCPRCLSLKTASILEKGAKFNAYCYDCKHKFSYLSPLKAERLSSTSPTKKMLNGSMLISKNDGLGRTQSPTSPRTMGRGSPVSLELDPKAEPFVTRDFSRRVSSPRDRPNYFSPPILHR